MDSIHGLLETVQRNLDTSMKSVQLAIMRIEAMGPEFSDTLAVLRETHRLLFRLDLAIAKVIGRGEAAL